MQNTPVTVWMPTNGTGEVGITPQLNFTTLSKVSIVTKSGVQLVTDDSSFTQIPASIWTENQGL